MPCADSLGRFIDNFNSLISELPTQHRNLIIRDFNDDQMMSENVANVDCLIKNLTCLSIHNIQLTCRIIESLISSLIFQCCFL